MFKKPLFIEMFVLLLLVGVLNYIATIYHLYWSIYEFDSVLHFLGGATVSAFFLWLYFFSGFFNPIKRELINFLVISVIGSLFIAVSWEIYELFLGEAVMSGREYPYDTTLDLIMDFLGIVTVCFYAYLREVHKIYSEPKEPLL